MQHVSQCVTSPFLLITLLIICEVKIGLLMCRFCKWNFCSFLLDTKLQLLNSLYLSLSHSPLHEVPYIFNRRQIWAGSRPVEHSVSTKLRCCSPCRRRPATVLLTWMSLQEMSTWSVSKIPKYASALMVPSQTCRGTGHWCTPITDAASAPFAENYLDCLFHLWLGELDVSFPLRSRSYAGG